MLRDPARKITNGQAQVGIETNNATHSYGGDAYLCHATLAVRSVHLREEALVPFPIDIYVRERRWRHEKGWTADKRMVLMAKTYASVALYAKRRRLG